MAGEDDDEEEAEVQRRSTVVLIAQAYGARVHCYPFVDFPTCPGVLVVDTRGEWNGSELSGPDVNVSEGGAVPSPLPPQPRGRKAERAERERLKAERRRVLQERKREKREQETFLSEERRREKRDRSKKSHSDQGSRTDQSDGGGGSDTPELILRHIGVEEIKEAARRMDDGHRHGSHQTHSQSGTSSSPSSSRVNLPPLVALGSGSALAPLPSPSPASTPPTPSRATSATTSTFILQLSVEDSAIGISADTMPKLFKAFTQADASVTRLYQGSGLGLAISAKLAQLMGGGIGCVSKVGVGTRFTVVIQTMGDSQTDDAQPQRRASGFLGLLGSSGSAAASSGTGGSNGTPTSILRQVNSGAQLNSAALPPRASDSSGVSDGGELRRRWTGKGNFLSVGTIKQSGKLTDSGRSKMELSRDRMRAHYAKVLHDLAQQSPGTARNALSLAAYYSLNTIPPHAPLLSFSLTVLVCCDNDRALHFLTSMLVSYGCEVFACRRKEDALRFMRRVFEANERPGAFSGIVGQTQGEERRRHRRHTSDVEAMHAPLFIDLVLVDQTWRHETDAEALLGDEREEKNARRAEAIEDGAPLPAPTSPASPPLPTPLLHTGYDLCHALYDMHKLHSQRQVAFRPSHSFSNSQSSPAQAVRHLTPASSNEDVGEKRPAVSMTRSENQSSSGSSGGSAFNLVLMTTAKESAELDASIVGMALPVSTAVLLRARLMKPILPSKLLALLKSVNEAPQQSSSASQSQNSQSLRDMEMPSSDDLLSSGPSTVQQPSPSPPVPQTLAARFPLRVLLAEDNVR